MAGLPRDRDPHQRPARGAGLPCPGLEKDTGDRSSLLLRPKQLAHNTQCRKRCATLQQYQDIFHLNSKTTTTTSATPSLMPEIKHVPKTGNGENRQQQEDEASSSSSSNCSYATTNTIVATTTAAEREAEERSSLCLTCMERAASTLNMADLPARSERKEHAATLLKITLAAALTIKALAFGQYLHESGMNLSLVFVCVSSSSALVYLHIAFIMGCNTCNGGVRVPRPGPTGGSALLLVKGGAWAACHGRHLESTKVPSPWGPGDPGRSTHWSLGSKS